MAATAIDFSTERGRRPATTSSTSSATPTPHPERRHRLGDPDPLGRRVYLLELSIYETGHVPRDQQPAKTPAECPAAAGGAAGEEKDDA
jgi:hypothetical protein